MPIREYTCKKCGEEFETIVRDAEKVRCPVCRSTKLKEEFSLFGGYSMSGTGSSTRPRQAGAFKGRKKI